MTWVANKDIMSANINRLLEEKGKTRKEACEEMGIGYSTFTEWANGRKYPRIDKIEKMANYFGVLKSDLIESKEAKASGLFTHEETGTLIKNARKNKGYNIQDLSQKAGVSISLIKNWENGLLVEISPKKIKAIADVLDLNPLALLGFNMASAEVSKTPLKPEQRNLWLDTFKDIEFTDEEFSNIITYAKFIIANRNN